MTGSNCWRQAQAPYSPEAVHAQKDGNYPKALRALVKRRDAIRMAEPFHVAFLAVGTSFVYTNGVLCYTVGHGLVRLLDIKGSADHEVVINVFRMLRENCTELPRFKSYKLNLFHYGHGVLVCRLVVKGASYLLIIRPHTAELIHVEEQCFSAKPSVVTSDEFLVLYYSLCRSPGHRWGLRQLNLKTREWVQPHLRCENSDMRYQEGVAGAVHDGHFYTVCGLDPLFHIRFNVYGTVRPIVVHAARIPLAERADQARPQWVKMDPPTWECSYRGRMSDDRWDFLRIEKDERTGEIVTVHIRRSYPDVGRDTTARTCFKRVLPLSPPSTESDIVFGFSFRDPEYDNGQMDVASPETELGPGTSNVANTAQDEDHGGGSSNDDSGLSRNLPFGETLHHGDSSSTEPRYSVSQCFVRSYFSTCNSFIDLVNDTLRHNGQEQSLRLRVMTEVPGGGNQTVFWPPKYDPSNPDPRLEELQRTLNPPGFDGDIEWGVDSGSFVYGMRVDSRSHQRAIVYVGFDPTVKLRGLKAFNGAYRGGYAGDKSGSSVGSGSGDATQGQRNDSGGDEMPRRTFPALGAPWVWLEEPLYFRPREKNGFEFFG